MQIIDARYRARTAGIQAYYIASTRSPKVVGKQQQHTGTPHTAEQHRRTEQEDGREQLSRGERSRGWADLTLGLWKAATRTSGLSDSLPWWARGGALDSPPPFPATSLGGTPDSPVLRVAAGRRDEDRRRTAVRISFSYSPLSLYVSVSL